MKLKHAIALLSLTAALIGGLSSVRAANPGTSCGSGWVFFDLGNTLIDTSDWDHLKYLPQAHEYLRSLRAAGFHVAMISNVPESWGASQDAKLARLKQEVQKTWTDSDAFDWNDFETVLLPPTDHDRKPAPFLFAQARSLQAQCKIAYEGEEAVEINAALAAGFDRGYVVGKTTPGEFYLPADKIFQ